jgi:hypothetical protein
MKVSVEPHGTNAFPGETNPQFLHLKEGGVASKAKKDKSFTWPARSCSYTSPPPSFSPV